MTVERSYSAAKAVILEAFNSVDRDELDELTAKALKKELVEAAFEQAWRFQFDEDRGKFKSEMRSIVSNAVDKASMEDG